MNSLPSGSTQPGCGLPEASVFVIAKHFGLARYMSFAALVSGHQSCRSIHSFTPHSPRPTMTTTRGTRLFTREILRTRWLLARQAPERQSAGRTPR